MKQLTICLIIGMDKLFWGKDMEDVFDWIKRM